MICSTILLTNVVHQTEGKRGVIHFIYFRIDSALSFGWYRRGYVCCWSTKYTYFAFQSQQGWQKGKNQMKKANPSSPLLELNKKKSNNIIFSTIISSYMLVHKHKRCTYRVGRYSQKHKWTLSSRPKAPSRAFYTGFFAVQRSRSRKYLCTSKSMLIACHSMCNTHPAFSCAFWSTKLSRTVEGRLKIFL